MTENVVDFYMEAVARGQKYKEALIDVLEICQLDPNEPATVLVVMDRVKDALHIKETNDKKRA